MQRRCKHAFPKIERVCFVRGPCKVVIKKSSIESSRVSRRQPARIGSWEQKIELSRVLGIGIRRIMARKELGGANKTSYVIRSESETVMNPLPG
jgi:hypothetical protein